MFKPVRVVATILFFATIGLVFVGAFVIGSEVRPATPESQAYHSLQHIDPVHHLRDHRVPRLHVVLSFIHPLRAYSREKYGRDELAATRHPIPSPRTQICIPLPFSIFTAHVCNGNVYLTPPSTRRASQK